MNITGISLWGDSIGKGVMYDAQRGRYAIYGDNLFSLLKKSLDIPVDNYAVMGCTAPVGEERMRRAELREGSLAVIEFGGNDCDMPWADISAAPEGEYLPKTPLDKFCDSVRGMIYRAREQGATPVLVTPPPLDAGRYFNWVSRKLNADNILDYLGDVQYIYRWQEHVRERGQTHRERDRLCAVRHTRPVFGTPAHRQTALRGRNPSKSARLLNNFQLCHETIE